MINSKGINARVIYFADDRNVVRKEKVYKALSLALVLPHMSLRSLETSGSRIVLEKRLTAITPLD